MIWPNIAITLIAGAALSFLLWKDHPAEWGAMPIAGLCLLVAGFVLWTLARFQLGKSLAVTAQAKQLVTRGPYSKIRNPIYVFASVAIAGLILVVGRPVWLLVFVIAIPLQLWRAQVEARVLEAKFGEEYRRYRARTWF
jgi:protein-S-isoprenylcysteine O-methyltransferase Ste14